MRFALSDEQRGFARSLDDLLSRSDVPKIAREWARGEHDPGRELWNRLAGLGVTGLLIGEDAGGLDAEPIDLVVAFEALGQHAVPGPWIESAALLPRILRDLDNPHSDAWLTGLAGGSEVATAASPPHAPLALDADVSTAVFLLDGTFVHAARAGKPRRSVDPVRRLFPLTAGEALGSVSEPAAASASNLATLACSAQLLGAGERLLGEGVSYATSRSQFGRPIGAFQALKHALADVRVALDFARPLVYAAALSLAADSTDSARDVSAAKVATGDAAYQAARTALQVHGAIGYTAEYDLGLWITKVRALLGAWGTPSYHRNRVLAAITEQSHLPVEGV